MKGPLNVICYFIRTYAFVLKREDIIGYGPMNLSVLCCNRVFM